jgi:hypothetical protein
MSVKPQPKADLYRLDRQQVSIFQNRGGLRSFFSNFPLKPKFDSESLFLGYFKKVDLEKTITYVHILFPKP